MVDLCCPSSRIAVEIDGVTHDDPEQIHRDQLKESYITGLGFRLIRFGDEEVSSNPEGITALLQDLSSNSP